MCCTQGSETLYVWRYTVEEIMWCNWKLQRSKPKVLRGGSRGVRSLCHYSASQWELLLFLLAFAFLLSLALLSFPGISSVVVALQRFDSLLAKRRLLEPSLQSQHRGTQYTRTLPWSNSHFSIIRLFPSCRHSAEELAPGPVDILRHLENQEEYPTRLLHHLCHLLTWKQR